MKPHHLFQPHHPQRRTLQPNLSQLTQLSKSIAAYAIITLATGFFIPAEAQSIQPVNLQNVAQLASSGSVEVQQDLLSMSLTTNRDGQDANTVQSQLKQALDTALAQAKSATLPGQMDVRTGNFSLYPRYTRDGKINGWQGSAELVLEGRDFARITSTASKIQSMTLGNVSFALSREQRTKVEAEAQTIAIDRFKAKALEVAKGFGFTAYSLREVSVNANDQGFSPRPLRQAMAAKSESMDASVPVEAGKSTVLVNVTGSVQMR